MLRLLEGALVIILGLICADLLTGFLKSDDDIPSRLDQIRHMSAASSADHKVGMPENYEHLLSYDPFFGAKQTLNSAPVSEAPKSSLNIAIFGLRFRPGGKNSVIVKVQGQDQIRAIVGDMLSANVRLVGIYRDRIEINRAGARESIYLRAGSTRHKNATLAKPSQKTPLPAKAAPIPTAQAKNTMPGREAIVNLIHSLDMKILRTGRKVEGFVIGAQANKILLSALALQEGDLLVSVNGESLNSYEKLEELPDEIDGDDHLNIELVRRGVAKRQQVSLNQIIGK